MSTNRRGSGEPERAAASRQALPAVARPARGLVPLLLLLVVATTLVTHWPVLSSSALWLDDHEYVVENPLVRHPGWHSAGQFFTEVLRPSTVSGYYQPLTMISLMADYAIGGEDGSLRPYHRTNLVLHALNAALVALFLYLLFGQPWVAAMLGVLFGCHPMTVETVAWLAERKTLLATFFALLCLILYVLHTRRRGWKLYAVALLMFVLALLSKPTTTPLPVLLLLLDYWPLRRLSVRALVEKVPFLVVAGVSAVITYASQAEAGAVTLPQQQSPLTIPLILCHNILFYPYKMILADAAHLASSVPRAVQSVTAYGVGRRDCDGAAGADPADLVALDARGARGVVVLLRSHLPHAGRGRVHEHHRRLQVCVSARRRVSHDPGGAARPALAESEGPAHHGAAHRVGIGCGRSRRDGSARRAGLPVVLVRHGELVPLPDLAGAAVRRALQQPRRAAIQGGQGR